MDTDNIILVGLMGAGKSTVGRELASLLSYEFLDTDDELERRTGVSIPVIFDVEGESGFRERESKVVEDLLSYTGTVISTGGGIVVSEKNRQGLRQAGHVVYLSATPELLAQRLKGSKNRPLLENVDLKSKLQNLLLEREEYYTSVSHYRIEAGSYSPQEMAKQIRSSLCL